MQVFETVGPREAFSGVFSKSGKIRDNPTEDKNMGWNEFVRIRETEDGKRRRCLVVVAAITAYKWPLPRHPFYAQVFFPPKKEKAGKKAGRERTAPRRLAPGRKGPTRSTLTPLPAQLAGQR